MDRARTTVNPFWWETRVSASVGQVTEAPPASRRSGKVRPRRVPVAGEGQKQQRDRVFPSASLTNSSLHPHVNQAFASASLLLQRYPKQPCKRIKLTVWAVIINKLVEMRTCLMAGDLRPRCRKPSWGAAAVCHIASEGVGSACLRCSVDAARYRKRDHHLVLTDRHVTSSGWGFSGVLAASPHGHLLQGRECKPQQAGREGGLKGAG